jgi:hypothetical protein
MLHPTHVVTDDTARTVLRVTDDTARTVLRCEHSCHRRHSKDCPSAVTDDTARTVLRCEHSKDCPCCVEFNTARTVLAVLNRHQRRTAGKQTRLCCPRFPGICPPGKGRMLMQPRPPTRLRTCLLHKAHERWLLCSAKTTEDTRRLGSDLAPQRCLAHVSGPPRHILSLASASPPPLRSVSHL